MRKLGYAAPIEHSFSPRRKVAGRKLATELDISVDVPPDLEFSPDKVYSMVRAISARVNLNADGFRRNEILGSVEGLEPHNNKFGYRTFIGKTNHIDHFNQPELADEEPKHTPRGKILHASYHEDPYSDVYMEGFADPVAKSLIDPVAKLAGADSWVKLLIENDRKKFPVLCEAIEKGIVTKVSMGAEIINSTCSVCGNSARHEFEFCDHARFGRGQVYAAQNGSPFVKDGIIAAGDPVLAFEDNHGLQFFEESWILDVQADPTAMILELVKNEPGMNRKEVESAKSTIDKAARYLAQKTAIEEEAQPKVNLNIDNVDEYVKNQNEDSREDEEEQEGEETPRDDLPEPEDYSVPANEWGEGEWGPQYPFPCSARHSAAEANPEYPIDEDIDVEVCMGCMYNQSDKVGGVACTFPEVVREGGKDPLPAGFESPEGTGGTGGENQGSGFLNEDGTPVEDFPGITHPPHPEV